MNAILDLKDSRADIRASLEARRAALEQRLMALDGEGWATQAAEQRRRSEADRRALALATGRPVPDAAEPNRADLTRELADVRRALAMHDAADAVASEADLQRRIDATSARFSGAVQPHLKALKAVAALVPDIVDALDDARIAHMEASSISDAVRAVGETHASRVRFRPDLEDLGQQLLAIAERAEQIVKDATAAGLK